MIMLILGLVVIVILALVMSFLVIRRGPETTTARTLSSSLTPPPGVRLPRELQDEVRDVASRGNTDQAVKSLQKRAHLPHPQATAIVYALQVGQVFPEPEPDSTAPSSAPARRRGAVDAELLATLRRLVSQDRLRRTAAIRLLRERTGMNGRDARRFLDAL
ncbi:hypothetical protein [Jiangella muralis]|uniref:hypothetical protein n=1 Tax=Jiangella muralis TaxID=702383 RepID=UPI00069D0BD5|nr:hypothetical protein [Jiangella muralis]